MMCGLGGFADVVDNLGGVEICAKTDIVDEKAHLDIKAGCQTMDGVTALGFVRARYLDPRGDLGRVERQRQFLNAISKQVVSPSTLLLPWELHDVGTAVAPALALALPATVGAGAASAQTTPQQPVVRPATSS